MIGQTINNINIFNMIIDDRWDEELYESPEIGNVSVTARW
jgi:hypothetical protein